MEMEKIVLLCLVYLFCSVLAWGFATAKYRGWDAEPRDEQFQHAEGFLNAVFWPFILIFKILKLSAYLFVGSFRVLRIVFFEIIYRGKSL